jgi:hypothetical protein
LFWDLGMHELNFTLVGTSCDHRPNYFSELMSITNRYFTSCFSIRSKASLIFWIGITSTSEVIFFSPQ